MFRKLAPLLSTGEEAPNLFWLFVLCLWSKQSEFKVFLWFYFVECSRLYFFSLLVVFNFLYSYFPVTTHGLDLLSGTYLNKLSVSMVPSD